jgi:C4-type Zn-finger protein
MTPECCTECGFILSDCTCPASIRPRHERWHVVEEAALHNLLSRAHEGEHPDILIIEAYANAEPGAA